ncbi:DUF1934 family protein [Metabacillus iocasae]|uniref:Uncharacterized beta-barrel protein YwiB (DUF1934 family) n=1 Tax=Priestia iocasae TaxID=2291674 RepID=A0ABS2QX85_9BACI|nr:uncharacterized beta-barrel protein YwiB (DUF1934 family) [Metabacillus iocasae]
MDYASSEKKAVQIRIVTDIRDGHRKETTAMSAKGMYYKKGETIYLAYKEKQEVGEIQTIVKVSEQEVSVTRSGAVKMKQVFRKRELSESTYISPFGRMDMKTLAHNIEYKQMNKKGRLFMTYDLHMQGDYAGNYALTITFKEA